MMKKSDAAVELTVALIGAWAVWYQAAPRPSPMPAFWYHLGRTAYRVGHFAQAQYAKSIAHLS